MSVFFHRSFVTKNEYGSQSGILPLILFKLDVSESNRVRRETFGGVPRCEAVIKGGSDVFSIMCAIAAPHIQAWVIPSPEKPAAIHSPGSASPEAGTNPLLSSTVIWAAEV